MTVSCAWYVVEHSKTASRATDTCPCIWELRHVPFASASSVELATSRGTWRMFMGFNTFLFNTWLWIVIFLVIHNIIVYMYFFPPLKLSVSVCIWCTEDGDTMAVEVIVILYLRSHLDQWEWRRTATCSSSNSSPDIWEGLQSMWQGVQTLHVTRDASASAHRAHHLFHMWKSLQPNVRYEETYESQTFSPTHRLASCHYHGNGSGELVTCNSILCV